jgi:hypothetical protein
MAEVYPLKNTDFCPTLSRLDLGFRSFGDRAGWVGSSDWIRTSLWAKRMNTRQREKVCTQVMYLCFAVAGLILYQGWKTPEINNQVAYRGSGRIEVASRP